MHESCPSCQVQIKNRDVSPKEVKTMKAQQTAVVAVLNPSYGYLGWTLNVYVTFSSLSYAATPTINYLTLYPHSVVGATALTTNSIQVVDSSPLTLLASITIPATALTGNYDLFVGVNGVDMSASSVFTVYTSPYAPTEMTEMISAIMPIFILMMLMGMMKPMMGK